MATGSASTSNSKQDEFDELREEHYNATIEQLDLAHEHLMRIRVRPDEGRIDYQPGQYTILALGAWESRYDGPSKVEDERLSRKLIKRAYSISCPLIDAKGNLTPCHSYDDIEFYITLVPRSDEEIPKRPPLTPRLFALQTGDRIHLSRHVVGHYTLGPITPEKNVIFAATGTGEAPHNAMSAELLSRGHQGKIASMTCIRYRGDAAYSKEQEELSSRFENYQYRYYTTREPENIDSNTPNYVGKQYLQEVFKSDQFEKDFGWKPEASNTHVFLCGNPDMIGIPVREKDGSHSIPEGGMIELLLEKDFSLQQAHQPGNVHFEKYW